MLAAMALAGQVMFFVGLVFMFLDLFAIPDALFPGREFTAEEIAPFISETIASYGPLLGLGVAGAVVTWLLLIRGYYRAAWFLKASRVFAWLWVPLIPVGPVIGVLLLAAGRGPITADQSN